MESVDGTFHEGKGRKRQGGNGGAGMILIANRPFSGASLMSSYSADSVERQVLNAMRDSTAQYSYDSTQQLTFELQLRHEIVNAADLLNRSGLNFAVFQRSRCNEVYWDRTSNGGFQLKNDANPAQAIRDIYENGRKYATECATAMMIVYYKALLEVFGESQFNKLFKDIYLMNWHVTDPLLRAVGTPKPAVDKLLGDRGYFANPDVDPQTPQWQGENVIIMPGGLYYGHGVGLLTADQIIRDLNGNRVADASRSAYFTDSVGRPDFKLLAGYDHPEQREVQPTQRYIAVS